MTSSASFDAQDFRVEVFDPGMNSLGDIAKLISVDAKIREFAGGSAEIVAGMEDPIFAREYSGSSAYERELSGYRFRIWYRGTEFFDGVCVVCEDEDAEDRGSSLDDIPVNLNITCISWVDWFLSGRMVMGSGANRYEPSADKADDVLKAMWRANFATGGVTPSQYTSGVYDPESGGTFTVSRANIGNGWTIAVAADANAHPTTVTHRWDHGRSVADESREFARLYGIGITGSWSGTTFTLGTDYPATGTDLTATIKFDRERGGLRRFSRSVDRLQQSNVCETRGQKRRTTQVRKYAGNETSYDDVGLRETGEVWRSANNQDATNNSNFIMRQEAGAKTTYNAEIAEFDGGCYGDFFLSDKVYIYDSKRVIGISDWITGLDLSFVAPGPPELKILMGREPVNADKASRRSGGGGGGSGRGGGAGKNADGESDTDPDDIKSYAYCLTQSGDNDAESHSHYLKLQGKDTATYVRARTTGTDNASSDGAGNPDIVEFEIIGDFAEGSYAGTHYGKIKDAGGGVWRVPVLQDLGQIP